MASDLTFPYPEPPAPGKTIVVAEGLKWLRMPLPMALDHINLYLIDAGDGWVIVDTGLRSDETRALWERIFADELDARPVVGVLSTHMHPDHICQAGWLCERWQVPFYMTHGEYYCGRLFSRPADDEAGWDIGRFYRHTGLPRNQVEEMRQRQKGFADIVEPMPNTFRRLREADVLSWGGRDWRVRVGEGHSPEHACLHDARGGVLLSGDQIIATITSNVSIMATEPDGDPLSQWLQSLTRFMALPADTLVLPAHGLPFYGVRERLRQLIDHHEDHLDAIEEACIQPQSAYELLPVMFRRQLDGTQVMMALGECLAHLHLLLRRGSLQREMGADGVYRYRTVDSGAAGRAGQVRHHRDDGPVMV